MTQPKVLFDAVKFLLSQLADAAVSPKIREQAQTHEMMVAQLAAEVEPIIGPAPLYGAVAAFGTTQDAQQANSAASHSDVVHTTTTAGVHAPTGFTPRAVTSVEHAA